MIGLAYCIVLCHIIKSYLGHLIAANYVRVNSHRFASTIYRAEHMAVKILKNSNSTKSYYVGKSQFLLPLLEAAPCLFSLAQQSQTPQIVSGEMVLALLLRLKAISL